MKMRLFIFSSKRRRVAGLIIAGILLLIVNDQYITRLHRADLSRRVNCLVMSPPQEFDVAVLGSSAGQLGINTPELAESLEARVLDLTSKGSAYPEQLLTLRLFLKRNKVKTLIFQVDDWGLTNSGYSYPFHEYEYLPFISVPEVYESIAQEYGTFVAGCWRWVPMLAYSQYNQKIGIRTFHIARLAGISSNATYSSDAVNRIAAVLPSSGDPRFTDGPPVVPTLSNHRRQCCERIIRLCRSDGVDVVLCIAPVHVDWRRYHIGTDERAAWYRGIAKKYDVSVFESTIGVNSEDRHFFKDSSHLNGAGAARFTQELSDFLLSRSSLDPAA